MTSHRVDAAAAAAAAAATSSRRDVGPRRAASMDDHDRKVTGGSDDDGGGGGAVVRSAHSSPSRGRRKLTWLRKVTERVFLCSDFSDSPHRRRSRIVRSIVFASWRLYVPHQRRGSLKRHLDRFGRFCMVHGRDQHTHIPHFVKTCV